MQGHVSVDVTVSSKEELALRLKDRSAPAWAKHMRNARGQIGWDHAQYIALVAIQENLVEALMDTGGACTIMDLDFAQKMGLPVRVQTQAEFGMFTVPGRTAPLPYAGCVEGPIQLQFDEEVAIQLPHIRLVNHGKPLCIIGADALCEGAPEGSWEFVGMGPRKLKGSSLSQGWACFCRGTR